MHTITFLIASSVCAALGRRLQITQGPHPGELLNSFVEDGAALASAGNLTRELESALASTANEEFEASSPLQKLATLLARTSDPAAGWQLAGPSGNAITRPNIGSSTAGRRSPPHLMQHTNIGSGTIPFSSITGMEEVPLETVAQTGDTSKVPSWGRALTQGVAAICTAAVVLLAAPLMASAENELAGLAHEKSMSQIVNPSCFAQSCKTEVEACADNLDCLKGLTCSAKCLGDTQCTLGCFAKYGNKVLDKVLQCTIEDNSCINIATVARGMDSPQDAPRPPVPAIKASPAVMSGRWYKVMGFNPNYDCMECQQNTFASGANAARMADVSAMDIGPSTAAVEVEYTMPRERMGEAPTTFKARLVEKLEFDDKVPGSTRTAHTEGRMFGLTFWENWYLIGKNQGQEPEFRFVFYNGKTLQNRYEGAFVYARTPELPQKAMPSIYRIARQAGFEPTRACAIDNACFAKQPEFTAARKPLFTPVAQAAEAPAPQQAAGGWLDTLPESLREPAKVWRDVAELIEDPSPAGKKLQSRQRLMTEVREYDANGYRVPSSVYQR